MECKFRENLRDELNFQNITVKELSYMTGISKRTLENYLGGKGTIPPVDYACKIAEVLNVSVETLVKGTPFSSEKKEQISAKTKMLLEDMQKLPEDSQELVLYMIHAAASKRN